MFIKSIIKMVFGYRGEVFMAMRKNDVEQANTKRSEDDLDDDLFGDAEMDETVEDLDIKQSFRGDQIARKRLEAYLDEKCLRQELEDDSFDGEGK